jgi:PAS domain S-box-containing protein
MSEEPKANDIRRKLGPDTLNFNYLLAVLLSTVIFLSYYLISHHQNRMREQAKFGLIEKKADLQGVLDHLKMNLENAVEFAGKYPDGGGEINRFHTFNALRLIDQDLVAFQDLVDDQWQSSRLAPAIIETFNEVKAALLSKVAEDGPIPEFMVDPVSSDTVELQISVNAQDLDLAGEPEGTDMLVAASSNAMEAIIAFNDLLLKEHRLALSNTKNDPGIALFAVHLTVLVMVLAILVVRIRKQISREVIKSGNVLRHIATGEISSRMEGLSEEFKEIEEQSNQLITYLQNAGAFARKIGDGDFDYDFKPQSEEDALGNALVEMRGRLNEVANQDRIRNWTNEGQAKFADILRQYGDELYQLGDHLISNLVDYLGASQGAIFILNDEEEEEPYLEMLSAYAFNRKKFRDKRIAIGEGLVGQTFIEKKKVYITDIRSDHFDIQSGLGESRPSALLIVPLMEEENIEGIIELASFNDLKDFEIAFVERIAQSVASSIRSSKVNRTTKKLLEETQEKAETMKAQEEELRQNMEELAATQEQMQRKNLEMENMQEKLAREKYLLEALLGSTQDSIYFKDRESKFIRISHSMIKLFGAESAEEVIGKSDFDFQAEEHAKVAYDDEQRIIRTGEPLVDIVEKETWKDGRITWVSTSKNPLRDHHGNIIGTFGISRDVTKAKLNELGLKNQAEWMQQYFSHGHAGLYVVADQKGRVHYASPAILKLLEKAGYRDQKFTDLFVDPSFEKFISILGSGEQSADQRTVKLQLNNADKIKLDFICFGSVEENEDGSKHIFLIGK